MAHSIIEVVRAIRSDIGSPRDDMRDVKHRLTSLEQQIVGLVAIEASHYAGVATRLDRTADAPHP